MAQSSTMRLRGLWLGVHKWIGLCLAILIVPIALSGAILVWHDWFDETLNPQRYQVSSATPRLGPAAYAASALAALGPGQRVASIRYPEAGEIGPVLVSAVQPPQGAGGGEARPVRTSIWLDPGSGRVLDTASGNVGIMQFIHGLHGSLTVPGWGRTIVGWVGIFMFVSCLTGLWLWWPVTGSLRRGLRWKRQNSTSANIHHLVGFWVLVPLAMLSFTGFWISFPSVFGAFEASRPKGGDSDRARAFRAQPLARTAMTADAALDAARPLATGPLVTITWPTDQSSSWKIAFTRDGGPAEIAVDETSGAVTPPQGPRPETNARLMRRLHDGTGMGPAWRTIIFFGGIIPAVLAVTGIIMWLRSRGWRAALAKKRKAVVLAPQPAE